LGEEDFFGFLDGEGQFLKRVFELLAEALQSFLSEVFIFVVGLVARGSNPRRVGLF